MSSYMPRTMERNAHGSRTGLSSLQKHRPAMWFATPLVWRVKKIPTLLLSVDCDVGPWGSWTTCSATCGEGTKERTRYILGISQLNIHNDTLLREKKADASNNGTECASSIQSRTVPFPLAETNTCNDIVCPAGNKVMIKFIKNNHHFIYSWLCCWAMGIMDRLLCHMRRRHQRKDEVQQLD